MPSSFVKMASGRLIKIIGKCRNKFQLDKFEFHNEFLVLPAMNSMILGNPFFKKHDIDVCPTRNLLKLPQMTFHMNNIKVEKKRKILQTPKIDIFRRKKNKTTAETTGNKYIQDRDRQAIQWNIKRSHTRFKTRK